MNHALCLGTFTKEEAKHIKSCVDAGGESRTAILIYRGRGRNELAKKEGKKFIYGVPLKYADRIAIYVRLRPKFVQEEYLAKVLDGLSLRLPGIFEKSPKIKPKPRKKEWRNIQL